MDPKKIAIALFDDPARSFVVELWDGTRLEAPQGETGSRLVIRSESAVRWLVPPVDENDVADAFVRGDIEIAGDLIELLEAVARWRGPRLGARSLLALVSARIARRRLWSRGGAPDARLSGKVRSVARDEAAVRHHYDVSNEFYRLFLDSRMVYSCAVFPTGAETLDEAQRLKLDWIRRKLDVGAGEEFLDVGCGWGALLVHAAQERGAHCSGATVSREQFFAARQRATEARAAIRVLDCDYRKLPEETFHKIASVGMMEHVGTPNLGVYFAELSRRLRPGGLLLNHAIADIATSSRVMPWLRRRGGGFVQRCIFPDSELPTLQSVIAAGEAQGLEVRDVESLREHYAETLRCWLGNLESRFDEAAAIVGLPRARTWRLYLATSAVAFRLGQIGVYQTLFAKRDTTGRVHGVPRWRAAWYTSQPPRDAARPTTPRPPATSLGA